jgi:hypothetical protein
MKQIRRLLLIAIVPALAIMLPLAAIAQSSSPPAPDSPETLQEQALALEAERGARTFAVAYQPFPATRRSVSPVRRRG